MFQSPRLRHNEVVSAILTTLLGGLLAISGGLVGIALTDRRERNRWLRDSQLQASTDLISALQLVIRRMINIAYLDPVESGDYELQKFKLRKPRTSHSLGVITAFDDATIEWNNARYKAMLIVPAEIAATIPRLDEEIDRILNLAHSLECLVLSCALSGLGIQIASTERDSLR
jgi:hypothetical protein